MMKRFICLLMAMLLLAAPALAAAPDVEYDAACELLRQGNFSAAADAFTTLGFYGDASLMALYCASLEAGANGNHAVAALNFEALGDFRDAPLYARYYTARWYESGAQYEEAADVLAGMTLFLDSAERLAGYPALIAARDAAALEARNAAAYAEADAAEKAGQLESALKGFLALGSYLDSASRATALQAKITERDAAAAEAARAEAYAAADKAEQDGDYAAAYAGFTDLGDYLDSKERATALKLPGMYGIGMQYILEGRYSEAYSIFSALGDYQDSADKAYALSITTFAKVVDRGNGIAAFQYQDAWGIMNAIENTVSRPYWSSIREFNSDGLAIVEKDSLYGYVDTRGVEVIPCKYDAVSAFNGKYCVVTDLITEKNRTYGLFGMYDTEGNVITPVRLLSIGNSYNTNRSSYSNYAYTAAPVFIDGRIRIQDINGNYGMMNEAGEFVITPNWKYLSDFNDGLAIVQNSADLYGFIASDDSIAVGARFNDVRHFSEGLAAVRQGNEWYYIDKSGNTVIRDDFANALSFSGGQAAVFRTDVGWEIIDATGKTLYFYGAYEKDTYDHALELMAAQQFSAAIPLFNSIPYYKEAAALAQECTILDQELRYSNAVDMMAQGEYGEALIILQKLEDYKDSAELYATCLAYAAEFTIIEVTNVGSYGFELNSSGFYESTNRGVANSTAECIVTVQSTSGVVYIDANLFAQSDKDYGVIYALDNNYYALMSFKTATTRSTPVSNVLTLTLPDAKPHTIRIVYTKDAQTNVGRDTFQFRVRFE